MMPHCNMPINRINTIFDTPVTLGTLKIYLLFSNFLRSNLINPLLEPLIVFLTL